MTGRNVLIVESGWGRGSLSATRSLVRAGHAVSVAGQHRGHAARSRFSRCWFHVPEADHASFAGKVVEIVQRGGFQVVFAGDDEHLLALSEHRHLLGSAVFPHPAHSAVRRALDKLALYEAAEQCGISVPETSRTCPPHGAQLWIAKQRMYGRGRSHTYSCGTEFHDADEDLIYQRVVDGRLLAVVTLTNPEGTHLYMGAQQAETLSPEPFGASARARRVPLDPQLTESVTRLLACLGWWGLAELQFVVSAEGVPHLIDFNGRFYGSMALTTAAGVDLPTAWLAAALGEPVRIGTPRDEIRYQWLEGDLRRAWGRKVDRPQEMLRALRYAPGAAHSIWALSDPLPAVRQLADMALRNAKRAL